MQVGEVQDIEPPLRHYYQSLVAQAAEGSVDVDGGQAKRVAELFLGERASETAVVRQSDGRQSGVGFGDEVTQAVAGRASAEADNP